MRWRKAVGVSACVLGALVVGGVPATVGIRPIIGPRARPLTGRHFDATPERLARGRYLTSSGRAPCVLCHSPMEARDGTLRVVAGMEFSGRNWEPDGLPFVTAPNLTPDADTGAGTWTDDMFARAIREGIGHDGRALFPLMPYEQFRAMTDEDLASIVVFLRSLPPVRHELPKTKLPFPVSRLIYNVPQPVEGPVTADLSTAEKRGAYIVRIADCTGCHTPVDANGNKLPGMEFAGGGELRFTGRKTVHSQNLTPAPNGIPYYTEDLFIEAIRTGKVRSRPLDPIMPTQYFRNMTDQDLKDVFAYLKTLKPVDHYVDNSLPPTNCARCGLAHGGGERNKKVSS